MRNRTSGILLALAAVASAHGSDGTIYRKIPATKTVVVPTVDGDISEEVWKSAPLAEGFVDRQSGAPAPDPTQARLLYDSKYLYVAFFCKDSKPEEIAARETQEDSRWAGDNPLSEDCVDIRIDPFGGGGDRDISMFSVNPLGTKSARLAGGRARKTEWKGSWDAAVKRTSDGWTAEMRIPWTVLTYNERAKKVGINFARFQFRTKVHSFWSNVGPNLRNDFQGTWEGVELPKPPAAKPSFLPYILPGVDQGKFTFRSGIDARYPISSDLTAVATLNPDFGTIEGAVDSIAFSRAERFLPERRPFFLEGSDNFDLSRPWAGRYFYPRRIERFDLGAKVYGKLSPEDTIGLLQTVQFGERSDFVGNWGHRFSPNRAAQVLFSNKSSKNDDNSVAVANITDRTGKIVTFLRGATSGGNGKRGHSLFGSVAYEDKNNFSMLEYRKVSDDFRVADGLLDFAGYRGWYAYQNFNKEFRKGYLASYNVEADGFWDSRLNGEPFRRGGNIFGFITTRDDWAVEFYKTHLSYDGVLDNLQGIGITRGYNNRFFRVGINADSGVIAGEKYSLWGPRVNLRLLRKLDIGYGGTFQSFDGFSKQNILTATYEFSPTRSLGGRMVERNGQVNWYVSFRDAGKKGVETFFILGDPNAPKFRSVAQVKVVIPISG